MDKLFIFIFLLFCAFNDVISKKHGRRAKIDEGKVVGGYNTTHLMYPYQVYLLLRKGSDYFQCGGSIIGSRHVLTAAHCLEGMSQVYVRAGSTDSDSGGTMYSSTTFLKHPRYNTATKDYDVGVVTLPRAMTLDGTNTKAVKLPAQSSNEMPANSTIVVTGWGATSEGGSTTSTLMAVQVMTHTLEACKAALGASVMTRRMFCAGPFEGGKDSCQGDSGGPAVMVSDGVQMGIVSFGFGCARPMKPGVYSYIPSFRNWILLVTGI